MPAIAIGTTTGPGLWVEQLWLDQPTTWIVTGRSRDALEKFCKRHGIRIYTIPGQSADGTADHRRVRRFILHKEYISGSIKAAEKGER